MNLGAYFLPPLVGWLVAYPSVQAQAGTQAHCHPTSPNRCCFCTRTCPDPLVLHTPLRLRWAPARHCFINAFLGIIPFGSRYPQPTLLVGRCVRPRLEGRKHHTGLTCYSHVAVCFAFVYHVHDFLRA